MDAATVLTQEQIDALFNECAFGPDPQPVFARAIEQAVLQSDGVRRLREDAERYRFCRSQSSPAEIHIHGVELGLAGDSLDEVMDEEMKEWKA